MLKKKFLLFIFVNLLALPIVILTLQTASFAQDPGWPRQKVTSAGKLVYYQPQVDDWINHKQLDFRFAFSFTPTNSKAVIGIAVIRAKTDVNVDNRTVFLHDLFFTDTIFPALDPAASEAMEDVVQGFLPPGASITISLDRLVASTNKTAAPQTSAPVRNDPPQIFTSNQPAILLQVDGEPVMGSIKNTKLQFIVNSNFPVFLDTDKNNYYLFTGKQWLTSSKPQGQWARATSLPKDMSKVEKDPQWAGLASAIPPPASTDPVPTVFYSTTQAEVILFKGQPVYTPIPNTQLVYASNTDSSLFVYSPSQTYYYLTSGRWFRSTSLQGPWTYATADLPADFSKIAASSPAAHVLASVPGTEQAKDAVLLAQIPTTAIVDAQGAAAKATVTYSGPPVFKPIEGTSLSYAVNTTNKVILVDNVYYLCLQGVWFYSSNAQGPWTTATTVPTAIYSIPPSSPVYNVTYVTQTTTDSGSIQSSYTSGYLGTFVVGVGVGAVIACGTGYYYPPYFYYPVGAYPIYHPYATTYGYGAYYAAGAGYYGYSAAAYGPYGGARATAAYNPYTGTYARGATAYGPYGSASVGQAYNPYTGAYAQGASVSNAYGTRTVASGYNPSTGRAAATSQGSNAYGQWGTSVVSNGNQAVQTGHYSNSQGTVAAAQSTSGAKAVGANTAYGSGAAVKTSSGDMYATKDGNVYKNTGSGWSQYGGSGSGSGGWSSANDTRSQMSNETSSSLNSEMQNRQRGSAQTEGFQNMQRSGGFGGFGGGGGGGGGRFGGGGFGGGGGRRR